MQRIGGYIYQVSHWGIPLGGDFSEKNEKEKGPFIATNSWIVLAVRWSGNYFSARNPCYSRKMVEKRGRGQAITKRFAFQANAIT